MTGQEVELTIDGKIYAGWKQVEIVRGIDALTGSFSVTAAARADGDDADFQFKANTAVKVAIGGETVITGWIETVEPSFDAESHAIALAGRDRTLDLVDCSAIHKPGTWRNAKIETIAAELAKPFGISVTAKASTGEPLKRFALQQGESVQEAIERLLRYRGLLHVTTTDGDVEIITPATGAAALTLKRGSFLSGTARHDVSERFGEYVVKGQGSGDDETNGKAAAGPKASAKDPAIKRYRPLMIVGEEQSTAASLEKRANWEATTRAGRAQEVTGIVQGFHDPDGKLWEPNSVIGVDEPHFFIDSPMLIVGTVYRKDDGGSTTELRLSPPEGWSQLEVPEEREPSRLKGKQS